jgi:hypothetical protein
MKGGNQSGVSTISLGELQYIRQGTAGPTKKKEAKKKEKEEEEEFRLKC